MKNKKTALSDMLIIAVAIIFGICAVYSLRSNISGSLGVASAGAIFGYNSNNQDLVAKANFNMKRVKIKPYSDENEQEIKQIVDVRHEFDGVFTANVSVDQLDELRELAEIEDVQIYTINKAPVCGDNEIHPSEQCGEPGLEACTEGEVCQDCKCKKGDEFIRTCSPAMQYPWGVEMVNGGSGGDGVIVTVLDTGIMYGHPDLPVPRVCKNTTMKGVREGCEDDHSHGTHVAGTIVANGGPDGLGIYGVAPEAELWVIKVCNASGFCYGDDISAALKYATNHGTDIVSMSFGGDSEEDLITEAIEDAYARGVLLIASAGNSGPSLGSMGYPAAHDEVMGIGAIDINENVPSWSSRGINDGDYIIEEMEVELGAPGRSVLSTYNNGCYGYKSGTSMSAPHVSGLAAKLWQGDAVSTRIYLQELAKGHDLYTPGDDPATGFGLPIAP